MAFENITLASTQIEQFISAHPWIFPALLVIMIWKLIWYGIAIYKSVERKQKAWFVVLFVCAFVLNDLGLLPIMYLIFNKENKSLSSKKTKTKR